MDHFLYKNNTLYAEDVSIENITNSTPTPFYCYSTATLERHYNVFANSFKEYGIEVNICFAIKSNSNLAVIKTLANMGAGGDAVSIGELKRCLAAGIPANKIVFSGVGKTREELEFAIENNIMQINVESLPELHALNEISISLGKKAKIALRVNPDIAAGSHDKISTGRKHDKFGIEWERAISVYKTAANMQGIEIRGVATHIGSQLTNLTPFKQAFAKIKELVLSLRKEGINIRHLDLGGGLGIPYKDSQIPSPLEYAKMATEETNHLGCSLTFEPGRLICGNAGILVTKVIYIKETSERNFLIVDAAMNDLVRPTLYEAYHEIIPVRIKENSSKTVLYDIVGPVCETGDIFARQRSLPELSEGDLIAIRSAGAYGAVMSSEYNTRPLIPEVMVNGNKTAIIRQRPSYNEILARDIIPTWL